MSDRPSYVVGRHGESGYRRRNRYRRGGASVASVFVCHISRIFLVGRVLCVNVSFGRFLCFHGAIKIHVIQVRFGFC